MANAAPVPKKILLFGATGVIGRYILAALLDAKQTFEKIGVFTSPSTAEKKKQEIEALEAKGVEVVVGDLGSEGDVKAAYQDYDTVISALGRPAILLQIPLLRLAEASPNIHTFYPSEYGTDIEYDPVTSPHEKPHQFKLQVRAYVRDNVRRLKITYLVTGPYSDFYIRKGLEGYEAGGTFDVVGKKAVLLGDGNGKVSFTTMADVGKLLVAALDTPTSTSPRTLKVNSFTTTPHAIVAEYEKQTGSKWGVSYTSVDELRALEKEASEKDSPVASLFALKRIWTEGRTLYEKRDNDKIGEPALETLQEQVSKIIEQAMPSKI